MSMKKIRVKNQTGITILEVLIAMIILSISLLLLLNMGMVALDGNDWSNKTTVATQLMQEKLEQLRNVPNLSSSASGHDTSSGVSRTWTVSDAGSHLRRVDVAVAWEDIKGDTSRSNMTSYVKTDSI
jgi:type II secretion system protein I